MNQSFDYDVIIAGGGPAGASAAIHLTTGGARVLLVEQKSFPRPKLCGEFISPECAPHFVRLGVADRMLAANPAKLTETVFYSRKGKSVRVPSAWFGASGVALGLSRAEMDERLLRRAGDAGARIMEDTQVADLLFDEDCDKTRVTGLIVKKDGSEVSYRAPLTIDATGRTRSLARRVRQSPNKVKPQRAQLVAFKTHLENAHVTPGACEIYFYRGGYGGLSSIENGLSNLCFIASARDVRECGADAERLVREVVCQNRRAAQTLEQARTLTPWLAVTLDGFGRHSVTPAQGLVAIGDAASFIDPFTGSGMLMALESGELAAKIIGDRIDTIRCGTGLKELERAYASAYQTRFHSRLRLCSLIRRAAFAPHLAQLAISVFGSSDRLRQRVSRATRGASSETYYLHNRLSDGG
jgi:flavin-dependent dehydrogenase